MTDYTGIKCPVCGKAFTADDDIVVCPKCGAPYHRECYAQEGKCVYDEKHGTSEAWEPPKSVPVQDNTKEQTKPCPNCGALNSENSKFCQHCGRSLTQQDFQGFPQGGGFPPFGGFMQNGIPFDSTQQDGMPQGDSQNQQIPFIFDPMGGVNPNEPIEDIPAGDIAKFVQNNTQYYLPAFLNLNRFKSNRFNFSAFLFSGGWMIYRKQYKIGAAITSIMVVLYLVSLYVSLYFIRPFTLALLQQVGITDTSVPTTYDQFLQMSNLLFQQPVEKLIILFVPPLIALIQFIIMLVVGFNGNKWYMQHCVSTVKKIYAEKPKPVEAAIQLQEQGGVNTPLAASLLICYIFIMLILY